MGGIAFCFSVLAGSTGYMLLTAGLAIIVAISLFIDFSKRSLAIRGALGANPNVKIVFNEKRLRLGEVADFEWIFSSKMNFNAISIVIKAKERFNDSPFEDPERYHEFGHEKKQLKKRPETKVVEHEFFNQEIAKENLSTELSSGRSGLTLPKDMPHSIISPHFAALWVMDVRASRNGKEQLVASFDLDVFPENYTEHAL